MTSPAKRLRPTAPPSPIALTITPTVPAVGPTATEVAAEVAADTWPTFTIAAEAITGEVPTVSLLENGVPVEVDPIDLTPGEAAIITAIEAWSATITDRLNVLTDAVNVVGNQQQWTTDTISQLKGEFEGMMAAGGPLKMLSSMFGGKR